MLDFFRADCQYPPFSDASFGLCDDGKATRAYPDNNEPDKWIATVNNADGVNVVVTAVDKCVFRDDEYVGRRRCDVMLTAEKLLYLVELKDCDPPWQSEAIEQLKSTIQFLMGTHNIDRFTKRKAFACNKRRNRFVAIDNEENITFFQQTTFRLDIQTDILII